MQKQIILHNQTLGYNFRESKRARRIRIAVHCDGTIRVTVPRRVGEEAAERFLQEKARWLLSKIKFFQNVAKQPHIRLNASDYKKHKEKAIILAKEKAAFFARHYGVSYQNISIKNQKTCWGSCSKKGNLNFNVRLAFLPEHMQNYIVVHELCHLKELNHSKKFWKLVEETVPDYLVVKRELKRVGIRFV